MPGKNALILYPTDPRTAVEFVEASWRRHLRIDLVIAGHQMAALATGLVLALATGNRNGNRDFGSFMYKMMGDPVFARLLGMKRRDCRAAEQFRPLTGLGVSDDSTYGAPCARGEATGGFWRHLLDHVRHRSWKRSRQRRCRDLFARMLREALHRIGDSTVGTSTEALAAAMAHQYRQPDSPWPELVLIGSERMKGTLEPFRFVWFRPKTHESYFDRLQTWCLSLEQERYRTADNQNVRFDGQRYEVIPPLSRWHAWTNSRSSDAQRLLLDSLVACSLPRDCVIEAAGGRSFSCEVEFHQLCQEARFANATEIFVLGCQPSSSHQNILDLHRQASLHQHVCRDMLDRHVLSNRFFNLAAEQREDVRGSAGVIASILRTIGKFPPRDRHDRGWAKVTEWLQLLSRSEREQHGMVLDADEEQRTGRRACVLVSCRSFCGDDQKPLDLAKSRCKAREAVRNGLATSYETDYFECLDGDVTAEKVEELVFAAAKQARGSGGRLLVVLQGHGREFRPNGGNHHEYVFATADVPREDNHDVVHTRGILPATLRKWLNSEDIREIDHVAIILDCCFSTEMIVKGDGSGNPKSRIWTRAEINTARDKMQSRTVIATGVKPFDGRFLTVLLAQINAALKLPGEAPRRNLETAFDRAAKEWTGLNIQTGHPFDAQIWPRSESREFGQAPMSFPL